MKPTFAALATAAAAVTLATGCIVVGDDTRAGDPLDARFILDWDTVDAFTNEPLDCYSVGADTVRVTSRNASTGKVYVDLFDCGDLYGSTYALTAGDYYVTADLAFCGNDEGCSFPILLSSAPSDGPIGVWDDLDYDLGLFIFLVD